MRNEDTPGAAASLRTLAAAFVELLGTRAELALLELREEGERRKELLVLALCGALFLALALLLAALFVVVVFWDTHRLAALGAVTLAYLAIAVGAFATLRRRANRAPPAFEATLAELKADLRCLGRHDG